MPTSALSPLPFSLPTSSSSCSYTYPPTLCNSKVYCFSASRTREPIIPNCVKAPSLHYRRSKRSAELRTVRVRSSASSNMPIKECEEGEEGENSPALPEQEANSRPRRIALFVEPSPFS